MERDPDPTPPPEADPEDHAGGSPRESEQLPEEGPAGAGEQEAEGRDESGGAPARQDRGEPATGHPDESAG